MSPEEKKEQAGPTPSEMAEEKESPEGGTPPKKKKGRVIRYGVFLFGSFVVTFIVVWIWVVRFEYPRRIQEQSKEQTQGVVEEVGSEVDSVTVVPENREDASVDSTEAMSDENADQFEKMRLVEHISYLKEQLDEKQSSVQALSEVMEQKEQLSDEVVRLKSENEAQQREIEYFKNALPEKVVDKLSDSQMASPAEVQRGEATGGRTDAATGAVPTTGGGEAGGIKKLAKIYEAMRPEDAASILTKLDDGEIVEILLRMRQRQAAKVLTSFDPALAARISKRIGEK